MALTLPASFESDIQGRDNNLIPIVIFETSSFSPSDIMVSTNDLTLGDRHFAPLLLNIPSLKESIDIEKRNYKIPSVKLDISNIPYNGKRFSERVSEIEDGFAQSLINVAVKIYWISQSYPKNHTIGFDSVGDDYAFQVYHGSIRRYEHDDEEVKLIVEDKSQATLHRDLPIANLGTGGEIPDKYKGKPIPMVYGHVDRSPCVATIDESERLNIHPDTETSTSTLNGDNPFIIYQDDKYLNVLSNSDKITQWGYKNTEQYIESGNVINLSKQLPTGDLYEFGWEILSPLQENCCAVVEEQYSTSSELFTWDNNSRYTFYDGIIRDTRYLATSIGQETLVATGVIAYPDYAPEAEVNPTWYMYRIKYLFNTINNITGMNFNGDVYLLWDIDYNISIDGINAGKTVYLSGYKDMEPNDTDYPHEGGFTIRDFTTDGNFSETDSIDRGFLSIEEPDKYNTVTLSLSTEEVNSILGYLNVNTIKRTAYYLVGKFIESDFYANVEGRKNAGNYFFQDSIAIIKDIISELNPDINIPLTEDVLQDPYGSQQYDPLWKYAFTVDKKINSKKLIEEISSASTYIPRFTNMGEFKFDIIKPTYASADFTIRKDDVINFSYSRTKIEDVKTAIRFKYHWDYAREEFSKDLSDSDLGGTTGFLKVNTILNITHPVGYETSYYGLKSDHSESTLIIDDHRGKYIRDNTTAYNFAKWILLFNCNQHLNIKVKLPLKYMNLEIGDIVEFDNILGDVMPYGIDYTTLGEINTQQIFPYFMILSTNKTLEWVEIETIMMHNLTGEELVAVSGCMDTVAYNYNPDATVHDESSCVSPKFEYWCMVPHLVTNSTGDIILNPDFNLSAYGYELSDIQAMGYPDCDGCEIYMPTEDETGMVDIESFYYHEGNQGSVYTPAKATGVPLENRPGGGGVLLYEEDEEGNPTFPQKIYDYDGQQPYQVYNECDFNPTELYAHMIRVDIHTGGSLFDEYNWQTLNMETGDGESSPEIEFFHAAQGLVLETQLGDTTGQMTFQDIYNYWSENVLYIQEGDGSWTAILVLRLRVTQLTFYNEEELDDFSVNIGGPGIHYGGMNWQSVDQYDPNDQYEFYITENLNPDDGAWIESSVLEGYEYINVNPTININYRYPDRNSPLDLTIKIIKDINWADDQCLLGDMNDDGAWNVLDIVILANCILNNNCDDHEFACAADVNGDNFYNVLDIVQLSNCILSNSCEGAFD